MNLWPQQTPFFTSIEQIQQYVSNACGKWGWLLLSSSSFLPFALSPSFFFMLPFKTCCHSRAQKTCQAPSLSCERKLEASSVHLFRAADDRHLWLLGHILKTPALLLRSSLCFKSLSLSDQRDRLRQRREGNFWLINCVKINVPSSFSPTAHFICCTPVRSFHK